MNTTAKLLLHCPDQPGILAEVTNFITINKGNIVYLDQYVDHVENIFFMRIEWEIKDFFIPKNKINPIETKKTYQEYVNKKSPNSPILKNCFNAFWVGGLICTIGQIIMNICKERGFDQTTSGTIVSIILIAISAFLTGLNIFNKIGKFAGAGSLVPITGFANSIVSPAMEYKSEGYVMGVGGKMFTVAGPVLVFGISTSIAVGLIYLILNI